MNERRRGKESLPRPPARPPTLLSPRSHFLLLLLFPFPSMCVISCTFSFFLPPLSLPLPLLFLAASSSGEASVLYCTGQSERDDGEGGNQYRPSSFFFFFLCFVHIWACEQNEARSITFTDCIKSKIKRPLETGHLIASKS